MLRVLEQIEAEVGVPVVSSNAALFWHLLRLSGVADPIDGFGKLFTLPLVG